MRFVLRGLPSLPTRLAAHDAHAREVAEWLADRPEVVRVLHPALPDCPGHDNWKRAIKGAHDEECQAVECMSGLRDRILGTLEETVRHGNSPGQTDVLNMAADVQALNRAKMHNRQAKEGPFGFARTCEYELKVKGIINGIRAGCSLYAGASRDRYTRSLRSTVTGPSS